jgi:hypothetical protein
MELEAGGHHVPLFLFLSRMLKIVVFTRREWQRFEQKLHVRQELLVIDLRHREFTRTNLSAFPFLACICRCLVIGYLW